MKKAIRFLMASVYCLFCCAILVGCGDDPQKASSLGNVTNLQGEFLNGSKTSAVASEVTFYGQLPVVPYELPVLTMHEALKSAGFDTQTEPIELDKRLVGYFSLDLSALTPICRTKEGHVLCRLTTDSEPLFLFVLNEVSPTSVQLLKKSDWALMDSGYTILLDGAIPTEEETALCKSLVDAFSKYFGHERDSSESKGSIHDISIVPEGLSGLQFHISYCETRYGDGSVVYSTPTDGEYAEIWDWIPPVTFFGQTRCGFPEVPMKPIRDVLAEAGIDPAMGPMILQESFSGYYSLDLSNLLPLYTSEAGEYVCRLEADNETELLFVLNAWEEPSEIRFYSKKDWSWLEENQTLLLDGMIPSEEELEICEKLLHAYLDGWGAEKATLSELDGNVEPHLITISFSRLPGLQFNVPFVTRFDPAGFDIYCTLRQEKIFLPR